MSGAWRRDSRADPESSGQLGPVSTGNEDATFAADGVEAIFWEGTPNRDANLLA